ncbi:MAG: sigma 54-interacting transcriptional regulator [Desulfomonilaceae bacterium]
MRDETRKSSSDAGETIHFSAYWNPTVEFDPTAPKGMKLWAKVLERFSKDPKQRYTLYGKVSQTPGKLGIDLKEIPTLNTQIEDQNRDGETHIYLFNTAHIEDHPYIVRSLHVGCVEAILDEKSISRFRDHIPTEFYDSVTEKGYPVPVWFKITDLREIPLSQFDNLLAYYPASGKWAKFDQENDLSPLKVREKQPQIWFKTVPKPDKPWYKLVMLSSVSGKREPLEPGMFRSPVIRDVYTKSLKYMRYGDPILILGERGTGKTVLASFIRHNYLRLIKKKPVEEIPSHWTQVPCGEFLNPQLLKSELFGWKKGAHSEAKTDHPGLLKQADGDCIFFDEIHDLDKQVQRLLIKALEDKKFRPLLASSDEDSDFLLLAASNRTIPELKARLDDDFLDRIQDATLILPPLRELEEDMLLLWQFEYEKAKAKITGGGEPRTPLSPMEEKAVVEILKREELPGNFRDLTRVAMRVMELLDDPKADFSPEKAVREALRGRPRGAEPKGNLSVSIPSSSEESQLGSSVLAASNEKSGAATNATRTVLQAFLTGKRLNEVLPAEVNVDVEGLLRDLRGYLLANQSDSKATHIQPRQTSAERTFISEHLSRADTGGTLLKDIYKVYTAWAYGNSCRPVSDRSLKKAIEEEFHIKSKHRKEGQFLPGVLLKIMGDDSMRK